MSGELRGKRIAFMMANEGVEEVELTRPLEAAKQAGAFVDLIAPKFGNIQAMNHLDHGHIFSVDKVTAEIHADDYDAVMLPGGVANPDQLRMDEDAVGFLQKMGGSGKPIAAICHAPWTLIEAGLVEGRTMTSWPSLQTDLRNAGAIWVDKAVCVDNGLVTSRKPDDLDAFCSAMVTAFS